MNVWITKYALTRGIETATGEVVSEGMFHISPQKVGVFSQYFHGHDWHVTKEAALCRANEMRVRAIKNLEKKLETLKSMKFEA
jgi:hypothetical protein